MDLLDFLEAIASGQKDKIRNNKMLAEKKILKVCKNGHRFYKSSDCPTCPTCELERKPKDNFLSLLGAPARRALENNGIKTLKQLSKYSEKEVLAFHGMGKSSIPKLSQMLIENGLTFQATTMKNNLPDDKISLYEKLVATIPAIELKGATMPYTSCNGHMFSFLDKDGNLGLRLAASERNEFINKYKTKLCEAHGTVLKEYVLVPENLFKKTNEIKAYFSISFAYVSNLKPKPTKNN